MVEGSGDAGGGAGASVMGRRAVAVVALLAAPGAALGAQSKASEAATVSQTVAGTTVTVAYSRPQARGRDSLIGRVVHWGETWTPGANWATTIESDHDLLVEGRRLAAGTYTVWAVPRPDRWTVAFFAGGRRFHTMRPDTADAALRVAARPEPAPPTEALTWDFPAVSRGSTTLRLRWGTTALPLRLTVVSPPADTTEERRWGVP